MERAYNEIITNLFVGSADEAANAIHDQQVQHVFDVRVKGREEQVPYLYTHCPILESQEVKTIINGAKKIADAIRSGETVYIHCGSGTGRAAVMAAAVLLELKEASSVNNAMQIVSEKRRGARFQPVMVEALKSIYK